MTDSDSAAVLAVHNGWLAANVDLIAESMLGFFPAGDGYLQFNLNGSTYRGAQDKARLWRNLKAVGANIISIRDMDEPNVEIFGDVALLTSVGECELVIPNSTGALERSGVRFRNTEFYRRDDGTGAPDWRIWHMHVSEAAAEGALKYVTE
ncbi:nuclear transport factor 2 family protein [Mycolicibacterium komossense]|uniref:Nuclear transport factor 2 family protein n=1 Tax=Mycolicibacterium komossense TaxID=1779 RepID=A0ABT3CIM0_9MYCO|nr:nuclear transport factor 2 family protein [Mycolicibacterium komossense]MCV7229197.1 nuclear transport factor 2 family protein [Mycolicibacterium komossense]